MYTLSTKEFFWHDDTRVFEAEISSTQLVNFIQPPVEFALKSERTQRVVEFKLIRIRRHDGFSGGWAVVEYAPKNANEQNELSLRVIVYND